MKRVFPLLILLFTAVFSAPSCAPKAGCPANESLKPKLNRKGEVKKSKKTQSGLFPKKMRKKMSR